MIDSDVLQGSVMGQVSCAKCQVPGAKFHVQGKRLWDFIARMFGRGNVVGAYDKIMFGEGEGSLISVESK
jgi:hypothetical protein